MIATEIEPDLLADVYRLTVDQYLKMIDAGVFEEDDRVEFIDGLLVRKMTRKPPHDGTLDLVEYLLGKSLPAGWWVRGQKATVLATGMPEPDAAIVAGTPGRFLLRHPGPADLALVVEVADSSLRIDRLLKAPSYARAGIPQYWIVNVNEDVIEVYSDPTANGYTSRTDYVIGQDVPVILDGAVVGTVAVAAVFPSPDPGDAA